MRNGDGLGCGVWKGAVVAAAMGALAGTALAQGSKTGLEIMVRKFGTSDPWVSEGTFENLETLDPIELEVGVFAYRNQG